jgi:hypothetical protein
LKRGSVLITVGIAFLGGFLTAHLIQGFIWDQGIQFSININLAKPSSPSPNTGPSFPESAPAPAPSQAPAPQLAVPGIPAATVEKAPAPPDGARGQVQADQPATKGITQSPGFQDASPELSPGAGFKESVPAPPPDATPGVPGADSRSHEVAGVVPQEKSRPTEEEVSLPLGPKPEEAQAAAPDAPHPQESLTPETTTTLATTPEVPPREPPGAEPWLAQVVVPKGGSLGKIIAQYYPGQEQLGLRAIILANPEISREDVIQPGQVLNLPQIDVSEQVVHLPDQRLYALYGSYYSAASWEGDQPWLEKNQVRFLVRVTRQSTGRVIHRVFLGGYETAEDLKEAQRRLRNKGKEVRQEKHSESLDGAASPAGPEEAPSGTSPAKAGSNAATPAPAGENQPEPAPPASPAAPAGKGETRLQGGEMVAHQSPPERPLAGSDLPTPGLQVRTFKTAAAWLAWMVGRGRNVLGFLGFPPSLPESWQTTPATIIPAENNAGDSMDLWQEGLSPETGETKPLDPSPEEGFPLLPLPGRAGEILDVLLHNHKKPFPEFPVRPIFPGETHPGNTGVLPTTGAFPDQEATAGPPDFKTVAEAGEKAPPLPPPEPDAPEKALPPGTIRRYWDAHGVLHIVNGELKQPNPGTAASVADSLKPAQPVAGDEPQGLVPGRKVSWPSQGQPPLAPSGPPPAEKALPPLTEGTIRCYRDAKGALHIVNGEPKDPIPGTTTTLAANQEQINPGPNRPLQKVSFPVDPVPPAPLPNSPDRTLPPLGEGNIRRYRDARGVLRLENVGAEGRQTAPPLKLSRNGNIRKEIEIVGIDGARVLPLERGPRPRRAPLPQAAIKEINHQKAELLTAGTIRRYRDARGVLHLETVEYPKPESLPAPLLLARPQDRPGRGVGLPSSPAPARRGQGSPGAAPSGVLAFRDPKGRLTIRNQEMETKVAGGPHRERVLPQLAPIVQEASLRHGLPVSLIQAVIKVESNFVYWAVSPKGAMGLMQLMPGTAAFLGVQDPFNPRENIHGGCRYLRLLLDYFGGSLPLALAAYNAGYQRVVSCGFQVPPIKETQAFVTEVLARYYLLTKEGTRPYGS